MDWTSAAAAVAGASVAAALSYYALFRPVRDGGVPLLGVSTFRFLCSIANPKAPELLLAIGRSCAAPVFRVRLPDLAFNYFVQDGRLARALLAEGATDKTPAYRMFDGTTAGTRSMFTKMNGAAHKFARKGVVPAFRPEHLHRMRSVCLAHLAAWTAAELEPAVAAGQPVDICHHMLKVTVGAIAEAAFEYAMSDAEVVSFLHDLELCLDEYAQKQIMLPWRKLIAWALPSARAAHAAAHRNMAMMEKILEHYRALPPGAAGKETVVALIANNLGYKDDRERCAELLIMMIAGHDTTSFSVCWALCDLAAHPERAAALRTALRASSEPHACPELLAAVKESMRLHPVAALGSMRRLLRDFPVAGTPYVLPAGAHVTMPFHLIFRFTGRVEQPDEYLPERWAKPSLELVESFFPFAAGTRNCVGQGLASTELHAIVAKLAADYDFSLAKAPEPYYALTNKPLGALLLARRASE
ncbi:hypothetical protein KFE25_003810 [Diacronema lutheri]|uniref:Cytochrome P450 n=2 Tax=Diacronema lutheri TaxID=2081491 RepID=A0A8J6C6G7_DIALT|nr:hypothetical protein KFE25_003810 [Diacronema lutheri]